MSIERFKRRESQAGQQGVGCPSGFVIVSSKLVKIHLLTGLKQPTSTRVKSSIYPLAVQLGLEISILASGLCQRKNAVCTAFWCVRTEGREVGKTAVLVFFVSNLKIPNKNCSSHSLASIRFRSAHLTFHDMLVYLNLWKSSDEFTALKTNQLSSDAFKHRLRHRRFRTKNGDHMTNW